MTITYDTEASYVRKEKKIIFQVKMVLDKTANIFI